MSEGEAFEPHLGSIAEPSLCQRIARSMGLDFADDKGNTGILVFVCRLSKMVLLAPVRDKVTGKQAAQVFLDSVFCYHGLPETIVSDKDPRFTGAFWATLSQLLETKLTMSTADHPQTDGQTERVNRVFEDTLRSICAEAPRPWSDQLPMVQLALNNAVHASTGFTPFYLNGLRHPQVSLILRGPPMPPLRQANAISRVRDAMTSVQDVQKEYSDKNGRGNFTVFKVGDLVLPLTLVSSVGSNQLKHRFIGPVGGLGRHGAAYTIELPKSMATHPTFCVGRLKRYDDPLGPSPRTEEGQSERSPPRNEAEFSGQLELPVTKPMNEKQAGTHTSNTVGMTVSNGKSSRKSHTHNPSGTSTPAAHKRASGHAPHVLERLSLDVVPSGQKL
ncbi:LOW QUALITY PROTEIN: Pol protein [Phytophthora palmivora]|uniref:Pol protein n=1 Tax=Phytophthora palmivora TaxID=4796 RepID=A0A2P4XUN1_9STRA|nr:LOW QUALITY PROTEIN: Pol protein [Phytophthora palmivora]